MLAGDFVNEARRKSLAVPKQPVETSYSISPPWIMDRLFSVRQLMTLAYDQNPALPTSEWRRNLDRLLDSWPVLDALPGFVLLLTFRKFFPIMAWSIFCVLAVKKLSISHTKAEFIFGTGLSVLMALLSTEIKFVELLAHIGSLFLIGRRTVDLPWFAAVLAVFHYVIPGATASNDSQLVICLLTAVNLTSFIVDIEMAFTNNAERVEQVLAFLFAVPLPDKPVVVVKQVSDSAVELTWSISETADVECYYEITVDGIRLAETVNEAIVIDDLDPDCVYSFVVVAVSGKRRIPSKVVNVKTHIAIDFEPCTASIESLDQTIANLRHNLEVLKQSILDSQHGAASIEPGHVDEISQLYEALSNSIVENRRLKTNLDERAIELSDITIKRNLVQTESQLKSNRFISESQTIISETQACNDTLLQLKESSETLSASNKQMESEILKKKGDAFDLSSSCDSLVQEIDAIASEIRELYKNEEALEKSHQLAMEDIDILQRQLRQVIADKQRKVHSLPRRDFTQDSNDFESIDDILNAVDLDRMNDMYPSVKSSMKASGSISNTWQTESEQQNTLALTPRKPSARAFDTLRSSSSSWFSNTVQNSYQDYSRDSLFMASPYRLFETETADESKK